MLQKHQSPSTCLRRSGPTPPKGFCPQAAFAQAGQIPNNIQIRISNDRPWPFPSPHWGEGGGEGVSEFGPAFGGIGNYLGFGYWDFPPLAGFGSGYAGLGLPENPNLLEHKSFTNLPLAVFQIPRRIGESDGCKNESI